MTGVSLRAIEPEDIDRYLVWVNDPEVTRWLSLRYPIGCEGERAIIEQLTRRNGYEDAAFAVEDRASGKHVGTISLFDTRPEARVAELGIFIGAKDRWGEGIGYDALLTLLRFGYWEMNLRRVELSVLDGNVRSKALYERVGFVEVGRRPGHWYQRGAPLDDFIMSIERPAFEALHGEAAHRAAGTRGGVMDPAVIHGDRVRLVPPSGVDFARQTAWVNDPFIRHLIVGPAYQMSLARREDFLRERLTPSFNGAFLVIEAIDGPETVAIGTIELRQAKPEARSAEVGILVGERAYWGLGYGTDAMRALCRFAFEEMAQHRIHLGVAEFNTRALRSYEQVGFVVEGRLRQDVYLQGRYYDSFVMGLLREDFEAAERARKG